MNIKTCERRADTPKAGDIWRFKVPGSRWKTKTVNYVIDLHGRGRAYVGWRRLNKGRYTGIDVEMLMQCGARLGTEAERDHLLMTQINRRRAELGKAPLKA